MATIKEIAFRAKVSTATVSNVLNGRGGASGETVATILEIARELNYTPNMLAKSLKNGQSKTIGIITEDLTVFNTPEIVDGIDAFCDLNAYHYILGNLRLNKRFGHNFAETDQQHEIINATINTMLSRQVEGLIYVGCHNREIHYLPTNLRIPLVCAYCYSSNTETPSVIYDDRKAAYDATCLLIENGHKDLGIICGLPDSIHAQSRLQGYQEALYDHSLLYNPKLVVYGDWERESGYRLCAPLLEHKVTAIFAQNDVMACGVIDYCNESGIGIGTTLSLVGFDNKEISTACRPKLSTVSLPLFEIGQHATEILLDILNGRNFSSQSHQSIECTVINRQSVAHIA